MLLDDPKGGVRDPQVHYDGQKILFSYRKGGTHPFHLYEINIDGTGLRQLTDGPDDDIEPTYCPDGSIIFCSSRCRRFVNCWYTRVATLYRCDGDGSNVRMLSSNNDHDNTPWVLPDGRILYMRWEYVDRSQVHFHHLWTMNPDGTGQMVFFGNCSSAASPCSTPSRSPARTRSSSSFSPGHGRPEHLGHVTIVDPEPRPRRPARPSRIVSKARPTGRTPTPSARTASSSPSPQGIFVMDGQGNDGAGLPAARADERQLQCHEPRPLAAPAARAGHPAAGRTRPSHRPAGAGRTSTTAATWPASSAARSRSCSCSQQLPKPVNFSGGMEPLTIGGSFTLAEILGTVPVEPDGSAYIEVPALRSLFFVALDENDLAVKRMHSFVTAPAGRDDRLRRLPRAAHRHAAAPSRPTCWPCARPPSPVEPIADVPGVLDFPRDIQPILDRHCVACHNPDRRDGRVDLCGDKTPMYTISYWTMQTARPGRPTAATSPTATAPPYSDRQRRQPADEADRRQPLRARSSRAQETTTAAASGSRPAPPTRAPTPRWAAAPIPCLRAARPARCSAALRRVPLRRGQDRQAAQAASRCSLSPARSGAALGTVYNLSRPEKSLVLLAPLAKEAGGLRPLQGGGLQEHRRTRSTRPSSPASATPTSG